MNNTENLKIAMEALIGAIAKTTELFYTQKEAEGYAAFGELLTPLSTILDKLFSLQQSGEKSEMDVSGIMPLLNEAMNAMEARDSILLADILQYDLTEQLEKLAEVL